nr:neither inactivation nor afterpotential protein C-like [Penaeus vannamei]
MTKDNARLLLVRLKMEGWAIGKDKVFLKYYNEEFLSRLYETSVKKIVKIQAMMRAYMQRKKKKAGLLGPDAKKEEKKSPKRQMTKDEAAVKIQSSYRGFKVRQSTPDIRVSGKIKSREKFGEDTIEAEAARYVQYYFRKWKTRTLFQQLQLYRAEKQQQLVYFSQQVHLYSQELQAKMQRLNYGMDLSKVRNEAPGSHKTILAKPIKPPPKLALDHTLNAYFDTTFLCDPSRAKKGRQQDDDWEAPFKSRAAAARASNMGLEEKPDAGPSKGAQFTPTAQPAQSYTPMDVRSRTAMFNQGVNSNQPTGGAASYNRFAGTSNTANKPTNYNKYLGVSNKPPASQSYNKYGGSYLNKGAAPKPPVVVNTWNDRQHNGYNDNVDEDSQGTHDFRKHLRKTNRSAILEMEQKAASGGDGAFNFQGMLRKTGNKRESLKRDEGGSGGASYHPNGGGTMSPTFVEETEEAML